MLSSAQLWKVIVARPKVIVNRKMKNKWFKGKYAFISFSPAEVKGRSATCYALDG